MGLFKKVPPQKTLFQFAEDTAEQEYHEILKRALAPQPEDHAKVEELLPYLGITWNQAKKDFEVLVRAEELEKTIADAEAADKVIVSVEPRLIEIRKQIADYKLAMEPKLQKLEGEKYHAEQVYHKIYDARVELQELQDKFPRAFGQKKKKAEDQK